MPKDGTLDVIQYEGDNETLVFKYQSEDFNMGSQLIVHESQEAVFFKDGQALDLFGPGRYTLETQKLPLLNKIYRLPTNGKEPFHSEIYFFNLVTQMGIKWGTDSKVRLFDPASGLHVELGASGEFNIRIINSRKLLVKVIGTTGGLSQTELLGEKNGKGMFRALVITQVKSYLAQTIKENSINILEIDEHLMTISQALKDRINVGLDDYGMTMPEFFVNCIVTPDDDPDYKRMKRQYAEQHILVRQEQIRKSEALAAQERKAIEVQTEAQKNIIEAQGKAEALRIQRAAEAEVYKMQAEAEAAGMRMKGYTYQQESARQIGLEAMKNGIVGGSEAVSGIGDLMSLGIGLGAMSGVVGMTKDVMMPIFSSGEQSNIGAEKTMDEDTWDCICGETKIKGNFCSNCGTKRPMPANLKIRDHIRGHRTT